MDNLHSQLKYLTQQNHHHHHQHHRRQNSYTNLNFNSNSNDKTITIKPKMNDYTTIRKQQQQQQQQQQQVNVKMALNDGHQSFEDSINDNNNNNSTATTFTDNDGNYFAQIQRKIINFIYIYAIIIISLYITYVCYYLFYQNNNNPFYNNHQPLIIAKSSSLISASNNLIESSGLSSSSSSSPIVSNTIQERQQQQQQDNLLELKLENKIHLLERYIELIAVDLQETKNRLREREKCDCSIGCSFNNTNYSDGSTWNSQCDICTCKFGKISCVPQKCPIIKCDVAITLPGQCCPTCMKSCKHNNITIQHGQKFSPQPINNNNSKECKCFDGLIKCEQKLKKTTTTNYSHSITQKAENQKLLKSKFKSKEEQIEGNKQSILITTTTTTTTTTRKPNLMNENS